MLTDMRVVVFVVVVGLFGVGTGQQCENNATLTIGGVAIGDVNTTAPYCFICPGTPASFTLGGVLVSATSGYAINQSINALVISDWSGLRVNTIRQTDVTCEEDRGLGNIITYRGTFFSLTPGLLVLQGNDANFTEGSNVAADCANINQRSGFMGDTLWRTPDGTEVGDMVLVGATPATRLMITGVTRMQAGIYTCFVPSVSEIPGATFQLVVLYPPEVSIETEANRVEDTGRNFTLDCSFIGSPQPEIMWTLNDTVVSSSTTGITITNTQLSASVRSDLTFMNASPDTARGTYRCLVVNAVGADNRTYDVQIASSPEPATMLTVTGTTSTSISLSWMPQFTGLSPVTGARFQYIIASDNSGSPLSVEVSGFSGDITGLTPFAVYNVTVSLRNRLGLSDPVSLQQRTDSNLLDAPSVSLVADSSTQMTLTWTPPPDSALVETASNWTWEFMSADGTFTRSVTVGASVLSEVFMDLSKGTEYRARVTGINSRGPGTASPLTINETIVDPPTAPQSLNATEMSSFAVNVCWRGPSDNGGRPVINYVINFQDSMNNAVLSTNLRVTTMEPMYCLLIINMTTLMQNTTYIVSVAAENAVAGVGANITDTARTFSIDQPQPLLMPPMGSEVTNISVVVTWPFPGGDVNFYVITLTESISGEAMNFTVNGTETMVVLDDLRPSTSYDVSITIANDLGFSTASPLTSFSTSDPPRPTITANPENGPYQAGTTVVLTCVTVDGTRRIEWARLDGPALMEPAFIINGEYLMSTLTISDLRESNTGMYRCMVGNTNAEFNLEVFTPTTVSTPGSGLSMTTIIIIAVVAGAGTLILIGLFVVIVVLCVCCKGGDDGSSKKSRKSAGFSPKKRKGGKDLFEISSNFTPTTNTGIARESNVSFTMPEEFQTHSSFNTMEKQNKIQRSTSPDTAQATSFGGNRNSTDGLMSDFQVPTSDGTML